MNIINFETDHAHKILEGDLNSDDFRPSVEISQFVEGMVVPKMSFTGITENLVLQLVAYIQYGMEWEKLGF